MEKIQIYLIFLCTITPKSIVPNEYRGYNEYQNIDELNSSHSSDSNEYELFLTTPQIKYLENTTAFIKADIEQRASQRRTFGGYRDTVITQIHDFAQKILLKQNFLENNLSHYKAYKNLCEDYFLLTRAIDHILNNPERTLFQKYSNNQRHVIQEYLRIFWLKINT